MARRRIGQEDLIARSEPRAATSLSHLAGLIDWTPRKTSGCDAV